MRTVSRLRRSSWLPCFTAALVLAAGFAAAPAHAGPSGAWTRISPPTQTGASAAYSAAHSAMYVFGGDGSSLVHTVPSGDPPVQWSDLATTGTPPTARAHTSLFYDSSNDRLLVFGGVDYYGHAFNDVWQLTLSGTPTWSKLTVTGTIPAPRSDFGASFDDARGTLFVFGGVDSNNVLLPNHLYQVDLSQPAPAWTEWYPDANTPTPRAGLVVCDDPADDGLVLFGGNDGADQGDAYTMSYGSHAWTQITATGDTPPATSHAFGAFDADAGLLFVWGGSGGDDNVRSFSPATGTWTIEPNTNWQPGPVGHAHPVGAWVTGTP